VSFNLVPRVPDVLLDRRLEVLAEITELCLPLLDQAKTFANDFAGRPVTPFLHYRLDEFLPPCANGYVHAALLFGDNINCAKLVIKQMALAQIT
jgi:hypothetical protein